MLPRISSIFKCEQCGCFFTMEGQPKRHSRSSDWGDMGVFGYDELLEAKRQFEEEGRMLPGSFPFLLLHGYNDKFFRWNSDESVVPTDGDKACFRALVEEFLQYEEDLDRLFVAELYRETGRFEECLKRLDDCTDPDVQEYVVKIRAAAADGVSEPIALCDEELVQRRWERIRAKGKDK